jgi:HrpA-like RNA helicase
VIGEPGTGVSTQLPQYLLESGFGEKLKIGITQPADSGNPIESIAAYVANEIGCELGTVVGVKERTSQETKIHYTTDDALEAEFHQDMDAMEYCALILDESSERIVESDEIFRLSRGKRLIHTLSSLFSTMITP